MDKAPTFTLLPPAAGKCQTCAGEHDERSPHNAQSLYYQTAFNMQHGRAPNWLDAMAHCSDPIKAAWTHELEKLGVDVKGGGLNPTKGETNG